MTDLERFVILSLDMERHSRGIDFVQAMRTFPSAQFHEWCDLAKRLEGPQGPFMQHEENKCLNQQ